VYSSLYKYLPRYEVTELRLVKLMLGVKRECINDFLAKP